MKATLFYSLAFFLLSCDDHPRSEKPTAGESSKSAMTSISDTIQAIEMDIVVFKNDTMNGSALSGWGFDILLNGKRFIHQPTVPVISGNHGFESADQANRAALLVVKKIKQREIPPALNNKDLKILGIRLPID